ncbi:hypothetical protein LTS10_005965 [Elasticomyces elasticus]|nr:hypothetical protein LTS10_005965 [Elasticomyces elasticus]
MLIADIRIGLLVGIGAGIPGEQHGPDIKLELRRQIQLGDVAVSLPGNGTGGVIQFDRVAVKESEGNVVVENRGWLNSSPQAVRTALTALRARHERKGVLISDIILEAFKQNPNMKGAYCHPELRMPEETRRPDMYYTRDGTGIARKAFNTPNIHYGVIASSNSLVKSSRERDVIMARLREEGIDPICVEMEAAGLMNSFPCLVVRGICDYADEHKNDDWQKYAAMVAAAYAKDYLQSVNAKLVTKERKIEELLKQVETSVKAIDTVASRLEKTGQKRDIQTILDWISPYDYSAEQHAKLTQWQPGTGQWFLDHPTISAWMCAEEKIVFCPGAPGADSVPPQVSDWYQEHTLRGTRPTEAGIKNMLRVVFDNFVAVYVVIDALDECDTQSRARLLSFTDGLPALDKVHILVTSRVHHEIAGLFAQYPAVPIRAASDDVEVYMQKHEDRLAKFVQKDRELVARIRTEVKNAADGLFLLVRFHLDSFHGKTNMQEVEDTLENLPTGIDAYKETYEAAMERINAQPGSESSLANNVLLWVSRAKRPLRVSELQHALAVREHQKDSNLKLLTDIDIMLSVCAGLVEAVEQQAKQNDKYKYYKYSVPNLEDARVVRFVHYTVEEYFKDTALHRFPGQHRHCAIICLTYLCFVSGPCETDEESDKRSRSYPWLQYAARYWPYHFQDTETQSLPEDDPSLADAALIFLADPNKVAAAVREVTERYNPMESSSDDLQLGHKSTGLHLVARLGLSSLTRLLLSGRAMQDVDARNGTGQSAVYLAASWGHLETVSVLVDHNAKIESQHRDYGGPLQTACYHGHETIARSLLAWGANVNARGSYYGSPLQAACQKGHDTIAQLLLAEGADVNERKEYPQFHQHDNALSAAIFNNKKVIVRVLLEGGADVNAITQGSRHLIVACTKGYETIVQLLLEHGADVNAETDHGESSLLVASREGHMTIVRILLDHGANVHAQSDQGINVLHIAVDRNDVRLVRLLLKKGADCNSATEGRDTVLMSACEHCDVAMVQLLLDNGAIIDPQGGVYGRALQIASLRGRYSVVCTLLANGADVNARGGPHGNALCAASFRGHEYVVQLLLGNGADPYAQGGHYGGAFEVARVSQGNNHQKPLTSDWESTQSQTSATGRRHLKQHHPQQILKRLRKSGLMGGQRRRPGKKRTVVFRMRNTLWREYCFLNDRLGDASFRAIGDEGTRELFGRLNQLGDQQPWLWLQGLNMRKSTSGYTRRRLRYIN